MDLNTLWFLIIGFVLAGYIVLDGADLGIGIVSLFTPKTNHKYREQLIEITGPYWNGNEVWLIVFGGILFAVFPTVYAVLLSGFYLPFIILLLVYIVRGISIPIRNQYSSRSWQNFWDLCFGISGFLISFLLGAVTANLIQGVPITEDRVIEFDLFRLTDLFSLWLGGFSVVLLGMHGAIYASRKSDADLQSFCQKVGFIMWCLTLFFAVPSGFILFMRKPLNGLMHHYVIFSILLMLLITAMGYVPWGLKRRRLRNTFLASAIVITCFLASLFLCSYPILLHGTEAAGDLTIYNASASTPAMIVMLILTIIAMPIVIGYSVYSRFILEQ